MDFSHWLLLAWTVVILYVLGEIWFAQIVVYPLFAKVGEDEYVAYHGFYSGEVATLSAATPSLRRGGKETFSFQAPF